MEQGLLGFARHVNLAKHCSVSRIRCLTMRELLGKSTERGQPRKERGAGWEGGPRGSLVPVFSIGAYFTIHVLPGNSTEMGEPREGAEGGGGRPSGAPPH